MLRVIQSGTGRPGSYPVNPNSVFQPGMIAQMSIIGNDVVAGVSDGIAPIGIIDDVRDTAFTRPKIDEIIIVEAPVVNFDGYTYTLGVNTKQDLGDPHIIESSFVCDNPNIVDLNPHNGMITVKAGAELNYTTPDSITPNAIRLKVSYVYRVMNMPGEDTTIGSGRITVWFTRGIFQTDQFEMTPYAVNANLYVSSNGKLTTEQTLPNQPSVAMVLVPPSSTNSMLEFIWW